MANLIINHTASGGWEEIPGLPRNGTALSIQARTAVNISYRWRGQTTFWTLKSGTSRSFSGGSEGLEILAGVGVVIEIEASTGFHAGTA
jgi:hypothetical protein